MNNSNQSPELHRLPHWVSPHRRAWGGFSLLLGFLIFLFAQCVFAQTPASPSHVSGSGTHTLAIYQGRLYAWGANWEGQFGLGNNGPGSNVPMQLGSETDWIEVQAGEGHSMALRQGGSLWVCGRNGKGQVGNGTTTDVYSFCQIPDQWKTMSTYGEYSLAVKQDGTLWAWGLNSDGQLGLGHKDNMSVPTQVGRDTDWSYASASAAGSLAAKTDGTLWTWGNDFFGRLGNGDNSYTSTTQPGLMNSQTDWLSASMGYGHGAAVKTDGTGWVWGGNGQGQLGDGTRNDTNAPKQVGQFWISLVAGSQHTLGVKSDGTLWAWGFNSSGQIGNGSVSGQLTPMQIGSDVWSKVGRGPDTSYAIRADGTIWAWGMNYLGRVGNGNNTDQLFPVQVFPLALQIATPPVLPLAAKDCVYRTLLQARNGIPPYSWSLAAGQNLPAGLSLTTEGLLNGQPAADGSFNVIVEVSDSVGGKQTGQFQLNVLAEGALRRELFLDVPGVLVSELTNSSKFLNAADTIDVISSFETPDLGRDNYGQRITGFITPPETGEYIFYVSSDDQSVLYLSTDDQPANKVQIAAEPSWNGSRQWILGNNQVSRGNPPSNISSAQYLEAGKRYYVEALHKEGGYGDGFGVTWRIPNAAEPVNGAAPISGDYLRLNPDITIRSLTADQTIPLNSKLDLAIDASAGTSPLTYQWLKDGAELPGQTGKNYVVDQAQGSDSGAYLVRISNGVTTVVSHSIQVLVDTTVPELLSAGRLAGDSPIVLTFSEALEAQSATTPGNYTVEGGTVTQVTLGQDGKTVLLSVTGVTGPAPVVSVSGIRDRVGNVLVPTNSTVAVSALSSADIHAASDVIQPGYALPRGAQDFDVVSGGHDIWGLQDSFHFDYQEWSGDFDVIVRVASLEHSGDWAKAGLMVRQDLSPGSPHALMSLCPEGGSNLHYGHLRPVADGACFVTAPTSYGDATSEPWVRLVRVGNTLLYWRSADGNSWTLMGHIDHSFQDPVLIGLATSTGSGDPSVTTHASYRGYHVSNTPIFTPLLSVQASDASASEVGADPGLFTVKVIGERSQPLTVTYTIGGTAQNGLDYVTIPTSITIPAGQSSASIAIKPLVDDDLGWESVSIQLTPQGGIIIEQASASVGIFDDQTQAGLKREIFETGPGIFVTDFTSSPNYPNSPYWADVINTFESPTTAGATLGDDYGQRLSGYLLPPTDGDYTFFIAGDDQAELWLSTDENPSNRVRIAFEPTWNAARDWIGTARRDPVNPENRSAPILMLAGQAYYVEVLHKESIYGDNVAVAWQKPGDPLPENGSEPISGQYLTVRVPLAVAGLFPASMHSGEPAFTLTVRGCGFTASSVAYWEDASGNSFRPTTLISSRELAVQISAADISASSDIRTARVTVQNSGSETSAPILFTIGGSTVSSAESSVVPPGATVVVSTAPVADPGSPGIPEAGVSATFQNNDASSEVAITAATYETNPNAGTLFDAGGGFVDLQVTGAHPTDTMSAEFYYPSTIIDPVEASLVLLYYTDTSWEPVLSSGGVAPVQDITDNLDGTASGGRFSVVFDSSSTPAITSLEGTVFAATPESIATDTTPPVPDREPLPRISGQGAVTITVFPTATDAVTGRIVGQTTDPLVYNVPGTYTVHWIYNDGNGNLSSQDQTILVRPLWQGAIEYDFNEKPIAAGNKVWFSSRINTPKVNSKEVRIRFRNQHIKAPDLFEIAVPDATVIFSPSAKMATTKFENGEWITVVPAARVAGYIYLSGVTMPVPTALPGGIMNIEWSGDFSSDSPGVAINWQWSAAVYSDLAVKYGELGVKPVLDKVLSVYRNPDHAGTPENYKARVLGGATGGGGGNYIGGNSTTGTAQLSPAKPSDVQQ